MCSGTSFFQNFDTWIDFKTAATNDAKGFGGLPDAGAVYCLRVRHAPQVDAALIIRNYRASTMYSAMTALDSSSSSFFSATGLGGWNWGYAAFADKRLGRLNNLPCDATGVLSCPVAYVGRSNRLPRRMRELLYLGHTVNHPLWLPSQPQLKWNLRGLPSSYPSQTKACPPPLLPV